MLAEPALGPANLDDSNLREATDGARQRSLREGLATSAQWSNGLANNPVRPLRAKSRSRVRLATTNVDSRLHTVIPLCWSASLGSELIAARKNVSQIRDQFSHADITAPADYAASASRLPPQRDRICKRTTTVEVTSSRVATPRARVRSRTRIICMAVSVMLKFLIDLGDTRAHEHASPRARSAAVHSSCACGPMHDESAAGNASVWAKSSIV